MQLKHAITGVAVTLLLAMQTKAQTLVTPTGPDIKWYSSCPNPGSYILGFNTAMIDYPAAQHGELPSPSSLIVSDYMGNGTAGGVSFRDASSGFQIDIPYCGTPDYMWFSPDIIVGNDAKNPLTDFRVAAAYINFTTGDPQIDYYLVHYTGPGVFVVTPLPPTTFTHLKWNATTIHLDVIAEAGNTGITGYPWCDQFIVTWDDGNTGNSFACYTTLNAPLPVITPAPPTTALINYTGTPSKMPDVAAIQRTVGAGVDPIGLFVTLEGNGIYYQEFDWTPFAPVLGGPTFLDGFAQNLMMPRIDAPDDYNINNPATPNLCYFKAAVQANTGVLSQSYVYDNFTPYGGPGQDDGYYLQPLPAMPYTPTVAYGGNNGTEYQLSHYVDAIPPPGFPPLPNVYMEPINWMQPASTMIPDAATYPAQPYFRINTNPINMANGIYINAISTPCNNPSGSTLCSWADFNGGVSTVYYKISNFSLLNPWGYAFKQHEQAQTNVPLTWKLYPSPATTAITIENPVAGSYEITDMLGRQMQRGELQTGTQTLDVNSLPPGNYIFSKYSEGGQKEHATFVKE